jgi:dienelactone hydrolase
MLGNVIFALLVLVEIGFVVMSLVRKSNLKKEKSVVKIVLLVAFLILVISPIIEWDFRWMMLGLLLSIQALFGFLFLALKKENRAATKGKVIFVGLGRVLLIGMVIIPALILPQYEPIKKSGDYSVGTKSYTLTDKSRKETFTEDDANRNVTIQFWYPTKQSDKEKIVSDEKFPLVIFSHGAFGYRLSNYSTFEELASNGYIVVSIDHTYHAFMTKQENGETIIANIDFINSAMQAQNGDLGAKETYKLEQEWMKLRTADMAFVFNYIKDMTVSATSDDIFQSIDLEHVGTFGHSLGGATAAQIGREDEAVDAVIVIDGTMMGEVIGFNEGKEIVTDVPYPKPLLNLYNESHYQEAMKLKDEYPNYRADKNGLDAYSVVIKGTGHMNFSDLPIVSPFLSGLLETGDIKIKVDARDCIETTNGVILQFFNRYLKSSNEEIPRERTL